MKPRMFLLLIPLLSLTVSASAQIDKTVKLALVSNGSERLNKPGAFGVMLSRTSNSPLTINYSVAGTASENLDYEFDVGHPRQAVVPALELFTRIDVNTKDDLLIEGHETIIVQLTSIEDPAVGFQIDPANNTSTVMIADDDAGLTLLKTLIDNEGGTAMDTDFTLTATGSHITISGKEGDAAITVDGVNGNVRPGAYLLTESMVSDYALVNWVCTSGLSNTTVTLAGGDIVFCTATNTYLNTVFSDGFEELP